MSDPAKRIGSYVLVDHLGTGGMGMVFRAWDQKLSRWVALKLMKSIGDPVARGYFEREARLAAGLSHPGIAAIYEIGEQEGTPLIAMQLIEGMNLWEARRSMKREEVVRALRDASRAVQAAHEMGIVHRDLKPANLMRDAGGRVFVMDFGLAKQTQGQPGIGLSGSGMVLGTAEYMPPEQALGELGEVDRRSDVYSLGATLYELLVGRPPFVGEARGKVLLQVVNEEPVRPRKLVADLEEDLETVVMKCLEKEKKRRYGSAGEVAEELERYLRGEAIEAHPPSVMYRAGKRIRRQPVLWGTVAALVLAIAGGATFGAYWLNRARQEAEQRAEGERAGRERTEAEQRKTLRALAGTYSVRARQAVESGDTAAAALLFAEANRLYPRPEDRANALFFLARAPELIDVRPCGEPVHQVTFAGGEEPVAITSRLSGLGLEVGPWRRYSPDGVHCVTTVSAGARRGTGVLRMKDQKAVGLLEPAPENSTLAFNAAGSIVWGVTRQGVLHSWEVGSAAPRGPVGTVAPMKIAAPAVDDKAYYFWASGSLHSVDLQSGAIAGAILTLDQPQSLKVLAPGLLGYADLKGRAGVIDINKKSLSMLPSPDRAAFPVGMSGRTLLTRSDTGLIRFWRIPGAARTSASAHIGAGASSVAVSADGRRLAAGGVGGELRIWAMPGPEATDYPGIAGRKVKAVPGTSSFIVIEEHGRARIVGPGAATEPVQCEGREAWISPDGKLAAIVGELSVVIEISKGRAVSQPTRFKGYPEIAYWISNDHLLLRDDDDKKSWIWTFRTGAVENLPAGRYRGLPGSTIVVADGEGIRVEKFPERTAVSRSQKAAAMDASKSGRFVFAADGRTGRLLALPELRQVGTPVEFPSEVTALVFWEDDLFVLGILKEGAFLWNRTAARLAVIQARLKRNSLWLAPGLARGAVPLNSEIRLLNLDKGGYFGETIRWKGDDMAAPAQHVRQASFSPDGNRFCVTTAAGMLQAFDGTSLKPAWGEIALSGDPTDLWFPPGGYAIGVGCADGVRFFSCATGEQIGTLLPGLLLEDGAMGVGEIADRTLRPSGSIFTREGDGIRRWDLGFLTEPVDPDELRRRALAATGLKLGAGGEVELMGALEWTHEK
jgi:WD40 repeat protein/predicted Ser/Thr protein kinase